MGAAFLLRVLFAVTGRNLHHPDEVFQYLEQAHRLVFGNGLVPWEFRFGTRSWIVPFLIAGPLSLTKWLGLDQPALYIPLVKILLCAAATCVVPLAYSGARRWVSEDAGRIAAVLATVWYELIYFSYRPLPDVLSAYVLLAAVVLASGVRWRGAPLWFGLTVAGAVALRPQLIPVAGLLFVAAAWRWSRPERVVAAVTAGCVMMVAGGIDRLTWGAWFASYINNFVFNVTYGVSAAYGVEGPAWYLVALVITSLGTFVMAAVWSLRWRQRLWLPLSVVVVLVSSHSLIAHKEYRFIFASIPILLMLVAAVVVLATGQLAATRARAWRIGAVTGLSLVSVAGAFNLLPFEQRVYEPVPLFRADPALDAFVKLSEDPTLTALFVADREWWTSGGYYYLHRDVPIYFTSDLSAMQAESGTGPASYASHVLFRGRGLETPEFETTTRIGWVTIRQNVTRGPLRILDQHSRQLPETFVDTAYRPTVRPFLRPPR